MEKLLDPVTGSPSEGKAVVGVICLHVDDLFMTGSKEFYNYIGVALRKEYQIGSEDKIDVVFTGQRVRWEGRKLVVDQDKAVEELSEVNLEKHLKDDTPCTALQHTEFRSLLGSFNWLQSRQYATTSAEQHQPRLDPRLGISEVLTRSSEPSEQNPKDLSFMTSRGNFAS